MLSAGWFYYGTHKYLVNDDLQMENQELIHMFYKSAVTFYHFLYCCWFDFILFTSSLLGPIAVCYACLVKAPLQVIYIRSEQTFISLWEDLPAALLKVGQLLLFYCHFEKVCMKCGNLSSCVNLSEHLSHGCCAAVYVPSPTSPGTV